MPHISILCEWEGGIGALTLYHHHHHKQSVSPGNWFRFPVFIGSAGEILIAPETRETQFAPPPPRGMSLIFSINLISFWFICLQGSRNSGSICRNLLQHGGRIYRRPCYNWWGGGGTVINGRMNQIAGVWNYNEVNQERIVIKEVVKWGPGGG